MAQRARQCIAVISILIALFYHMQLGLQVVIEDYVHGEKNKIFLLLINKFAAVLFAISSLVAIIQIAYGG